jgi:subtilisin-like proprotein convertase family protein
MARLRLRLLVLGALLSTLALSTPADAFDPLLDLQWQLKSRREVNGGANVIAAWPMSQGVGVVVGVVDVGVEGTHPDLAANYSAALSYDFDQNDKDASPFPDEAHGTAVAGIIAAVRDNGLGGSGVAPLASIAGLRLNAAGFAPDDARDAAVFLHELDRIDILNNSWGSGYFGRDGAFSPAGPGPQAQAAMERAVALGRGGKGRIFVWAAGNRGNLGKDCNLNGWANSRFGISAGQYADFGEQSWTGEPCAALFVAAPSTGGTNGLPTTDNTGPAGETPGDYNLDFGGSSSSAAMVSGVVALMLSRNPALTWRDVQHILVRSSVHVNPTDPSWSTGPFPHSPRYGFGLVDAAAAVTMAGSWTNVPPEAAVPEVVRFVNVTIPDGSAAGVSDRITIPSTFAGFQVEHVEVVFDASHPVRGDLAVTLTSPSGVVSQLATPWPLSQGADYRAWRFGSVRHWGESAAGEWTLTASDPVAGNVGVWNSWRLRIYGTFMPPPGISTPAPDAIPVYRFYNTTTGTHFYTASEDERQAVAQFPGFNIEGVAFYAFASNGPGRSAVYRFFDTATGTHFYTVSEAERDGIIARVPSYHYEGVVYYANVSPVAGSSAVFRFFNTLTGTHFYTASQVERDTVIATARYFTYEGIVYYTAR